MEITCIKCCYCDWQVNELKSECGSASNQSHRSRGDVSDDLEAEFMGSAASVRGGGGQAINRHKDQLRKIEREKKEQQEVTWLCCASLLATMFPYIQNTVDN